jgi:hypothetical protein
MDTELWTEDQLSEMTDEQLIELYKKHKACSKAVFCQRYKIKACNFTRWLKGETKPSARRVVITFLKELKIAQRVLCKDSVHVSMKDMITVRELILDWRMEEYIQESKSIRQISYKMEILPIFNIYGLVFLDGDQHVSGLMMDLGERTDLHPYYHFIVFVSCLQPPRCFFYYFGERWLTVVLSTNSKKDAVDYDMIMAATLLNEKFSDFPTPFILSSHDHFVDSLKQRLDEFNYRLCTIVPRGALIEFLEKDLQNRAYTK